MRLRLAKEVMKKEDKEEVGEGKNLDLKKYLHSLRPSTICYLLPQTY
jgi:hypothetical protein